MTQHEFEPKVIEALAALRTYAQRYPTMGLSGALNTLDDAGVFARLDEQTDYASAEDILAEIEAAKTPNTADPAEWGDTTSADMARHQGYAAASRLGSLERVPGTDTLRPAPEDAGEWSEDVVRAAFPEHEHIFQSPHSDEVCYGAEWCSVTYAEHRVASRALTRADREAHGLDASDRAAEGRLGRRAFGLD